MTPFKQKVLQAVKSVPYGKVASYGQIALYVGVPRGARQVGWILRGTEGGMDIPWWRIVNNAGKITIKGNLLNDKELQKKLLNSEGVEVSEDFTLDIEKHRFHAGRTLFKKMQLSEDYIDMLHRKYSF